jgi:hypothetical protein
VMNRTQSGGLFSALRWLKLNQASIQAHTKLTVAA